MATDPTHYAPLAVADDHRTRAAERQWLQDRSQQATAYHPVTEDDGRFAARMMKFNHPETENKPEPMVGKKPEAEPVVAPPAKMAAPQPRANKKKGDGKSGAAGAGGQDAIDSTFASLFTRPVGNAPRAGGGSSSGTKTYMSTRQTMRDNALGQHTMGNQTMRG